MLKINELKENIKYKVIDNNHKFAIGETRYIVGNKIYKVKADKT